MRWAWEDGCRTSQHQHVAFPVGLSRPHYARNTIASVPKKNLVFTSVPFSPEILAHAGAAHGMWPANKSYAGASIRN